MTGSCVVRYANLLACHSIRFSRFRLQRISRISCGFARRVPPDSCLGGKEIHYALASDRVNRFLRIFSDYLRGLSFMADPGTKNASRIVSGGVTGSMSSRTTATSIAFYGSSPNGTRFSTRAPVSWIDSGGAVDVMYQPRDAACKGYSRRSVLYPRWHPPDGRPRADARSPRAAYAAQPRADRPSEATLAHLQHLVPRRVRARTYIYAGFKRLAVEPDAALVDHAGDPPTPMPTRPSVVQQPGQVDLVVELDRDLRDVLGRLRAA